MKSIVALIVPLLAWPAYAQAPAAGPETRAQAEARAVELYNRLDLNGDGIVTRDEMAQFAAARSGATVIPGAPLPPAAAAMFDDADADHDGRISRAEAVAGALRGFDEADTNHDGIVTPEERAAAIRGVTATVRSSTPGGAAPAPREVAGPPAPPPD